MGAARKTDIYGAKGGSEKRNTRTQAPDSLRSVAIAKMLIAIGKVSLKARQSPRILYLVNIPPQDPQGNINFPNVKWEWRTGAVDQTYIQGHPLDSRTKPRSAPSCAAVHRGFERSATPSFLPCEYVSPGRRYSPWTRTTTSMVTGSSTRSN